MLAASMPPSQGHHVEDSGTLLGQSMGTSASALPSLDGSANVTAGRGSGPCPQSRSPPSARSHPPSPHRRGRSGHRPRNRSRRRSGCRTPTLQPPAASPDGAHPDAAAPLPETPRARARWPLLAAQGRVAEALLPVPNHGSRETLCSSRWREGGGPVLGGKGKFLFFIYLFWGGGDSS
uniref:Uncharacterized protein n=1 Tax=Tetraselmis sp. GSL018 TaxID=582737 RepID=A0A061RDT9_9CHLO